MKHLKLFENKGHWSLSKIEDMYDDLDIMKRLIFEYLIFNNLVKPKSNNFYNYVLDEFWFDEDSFSVSYKQIIQKDPENFIYEFTKQQFDDLLEYMNNPDVYISAKQYNL